MGHTAWTVRGSRDRGGIGADHSPRASLFAPKGDDNLDSWDRAGMLLVVPEGPPEADSGDGRSDQQRS